MNQISKNFNEVEECAILWQYRCMGDFQTALMKAIGLADDENLKRLGMSFPLEVEMYLKYTGEQGWWQKLEERYRQVMKV